MNRGDLRRRAIRFAFGDRVGLVVFLASICLFSACWRAGFLINDTHTLANGLAAVEHGRLSMTTAHYGRDLVSPGVSRVGGALYPRNFGVLVAALPVLWALRALEAVADLQVALVALWSLLALAALVHAGRASGRQRSFGLVGSVAVVAVFALNVSLATPLDIPIHQVALQVVHMVAAAFVGVFAYRLLGERHGQRFGVTGAVVVTLGTPLTLWASVPKRHVITAAVALALAYALHRSRDQGDYGSIEVRALGYALVGFLAWVHAPEALVVFLPFAVIDVTTAPSNDRRTLAVIGAAFAASLVPFSVTNVLVGGHPLRVPRTLPSARKSPSGGSSGSATAGAGDSSPPLLTEVLDTIGTALDPLLTLLGFTTQGIGVLLFRPRDAFHTLVRSGHVDRVARYAVDDATRDLALLESAAILAIVFAAVPVGASVLRKADVNWDTAKSVKAADAYLCSAALLLVLIYLPRLPIHAQVTVRYLFPVVPLAVCWALGLDPIRAALTTHRRTYLATLAAAVLVGGQLLFVALFSLDPTLGEAIQFHGLLGLAAATPLAAWAAVGGRRASLRRTRAVLMALATATAFLFVLFVALEYYTHGDAHVLPMMRALADAVSLL